MTRTELAALPEPNYLLFPHAGLYNAMMALPVISFAAFMLWFIPELLSGQAGLWHWLFAAFLGMMTAAILRPKARDWRNRITFAATTEGAWFVTNLKGDCTFVPWCQVRRVYINSLSSRDQVIKGIVFELMVDADHWRRLHDSERSHFSLPAPVDGHYRLGLSANLRKPATIVAEVERLRAMDSGSSPPHRS